MNEDKIINAEKKAMSIGLKIAKQKQKLVEECYKLLKLASIKTDKEFNEDYIADKLYREIKKIDNEEVKKLMDSKEEQKRRLENKIIKEIFSSI